MDVVVQGWINTCISLWDSHWQNICVGGSTGNQELTGKTQVAPTVSTSELRFATHLCERHAPLIHWGVFVNLFRGGSRKEMKSLRVPPTYHMTNPDMTKLHMCAAEHQPSCPQMLLGSPDAIGKLPSANKRRIPFSPQTMCPEQISRCSACILKNSYTAQHLRGIPTFVFT